MLRSKPFCPNPNPNHEISYVKRVIMCRAKTVGDPVMQIFDRVTKNSMKKPNPNPKPKPFDTNSIG